jgi:p-cumate 2,3-dioxygenase beta subunit
MSTSQSNSGITRSEAEALFYREAELLDAWKLDDWLGLLTDDAGYYVPPNDKPNASHLDTLFTIADDHVRLRERVIRLKDPQCHVEYPPSRTRRLITNVRVAAAAGGETIAKGNFVVYRYRRNNDVRVFTGEYTYRLVRKGADIRIRERRAVLDAEELGQLGSVSFLL